MSPAPEHPRFARRRSDATINLKVWVPLAVGFLAIFAAAASFGTKTENARATAEKVEQIDRDYVNQKQFDERMDDFKASVGSRFDNLQAQNARIEDKIDKLGK